MVVKPTCITHVGHLLADTRFTDCEPYIQRGSVGLERSIVGYFAASASNVHQLRYISAGS